MESTRKFSIFGSKHIEYARKKIACVCAATGTVMICATLGIQGISGPRTIDIYAKNPIFQKTVLQGAATNEELADDTLQGVESLFYTSSEQVPKSAEKIWKPLELVLYPTADGLKYGSRKLEEAEKPQGIENQKLEEQTEEQQLQNRIKIKKKRKKQKIHIKRKEIENGYQTQKDFNGWQHRSGTRVLRVHRSGSYLPHHSLQPHG